MISCAHSSGQVCNSMCGPLISQTSTFGNPLTSISANVAATTLSCEAFRHSTGWVIFESIGLISTFESTASRSFLVMGVIEYITCITKLSNSDSGSFGRQKVFTIRACNGLGVKNTVGTYSATLVNFLNGLIANVALRTAHFILDG